MNYMFRLFSCAVFTFALLNGAFAADRAKTYVSVAEGDNISVEILPISSAKDHYLIHFEGFDGSFEDRTALYVKERVSFDGSQGYKFRVAGLDGSHIESRNGVVLHATVDNALPVPLVFAHDVDVVKERRIHALYMRQQGLFESRVEAKKQIRQAKQKFEANCGHSIHVDVTWEDFSADVDKTTAGMTKLYLDALNAICVIDNDYRQAVHALSAISIYKATTGSGHELSLDGGTLTIHLDREMPK